MRIYMQTSKYEIIKHEGDFWEAKRNNLTFCIPANITICEKNLDHKFEALFGSVSYELIDNYKEYSNPNDSGSAW